MKNKKILFDYYMGVVCMYAVYKVVYKPLYYKLYIKLKIRWKSGQLCDMINCNFTIARINYVGEN